MTALYSTSPDDALHGGDKVPALFSSRLLVAGFAVICLALVCFTARDGLSNLYARWRYEDEYGYGFLIATLVPWLLWRRWNLILSASGGSRWPGLAILIIAQACVVLGALGESYFLEQIALIVSVAGIGLVVFGTGALRVFLPITLLLLLTLPLPYTLQAMLTIKLQLISTNLGVAMIQLLGIPVYADGNIIDLGTFKLQVAEACSGLRYLLPLTCISFLVAYLYKAAFWKKVVVVISAVPLTIFLNSFRIAATALLVNLYGSQMAEGFLHEFEGWVVFLVAVLLLCCVIFALEGFRWSKVQIESIMDRSPAARHKVEPIKIGLPLILAVLACAGTLAVTTSIASAYQSMLSPVREHFADFPRRIDSWNGRPEQLDLDTLGILKATDTYSGDFVEAAGTPSVNLFIAYYDSLSKSAAIHSPRVCLPGAGWEFASFQERNFSEVQSGGAGTYNQVVIQKGEQKTLMYYWYQQRERRTANEFSMKYYLLADSFFKSRKDGALVRLLTPINAGDGEKAEAAAEARLRAFAHAMLSRLPRYLPE
jgi:exosortase D (VPLPA-CTERM-specific)